jgi:hypothetical protein
MTALPKTVTAHILIRVFTLGLLLSFNPPVSAQSSESQPSFWSRIINYTYEGEIGDPRKVDFNNLTYVNGSETMDRNSQFSYTFKLPRGAVPKW